MTVDKLHARRQPLRSGLSPAFRAIRDSKNGRLMLDSHFDGNSIGKLRLRGRHSYQRGPTVFESDMRKVHGSIIVHHGS